MKNVKICVVGSGIGDYHSECYQKLDNIPYAVCDIDEKKGKAHQEKYGIKKFYKEFSEMLKDPEIEAVDICTPNYLHVPMVIDALNAGKHVICEKPMSINGTEAAKVIEVQKKAQKTVLLAFCYRFRDDTMYIKKEIEKGTIGDVIYSKASMIRQHGIPGWGSWFTTKEFSGGGTVADCGVHIIDLCHWLAGQKKVKSVSAIIDDTWGRQKLCASTYGDVDFNGIFDVEDFTAGQLRMEDGSIMAFENSWACQTDDSANCVIVGTKGGFIWDMYKPETIKMFTMTEDNQNHIYSYPKFNAEHGHTNELRHFIECVNEGKQCSTTVEDGVEMMRIIDAIYRSAELKQEVPVIY